MNLDLSQPRTGNLRVCDCGHTKAFHYARPDYYGGPTTKGDAQCGHCDCVQYAQAADQAFKFTHQQRED
jgi:hypothetical protein